MNVRKTACSLNCHISIIYRIVKHYQCHGNADYEYGSDRLTPLDPTQVKKLDQTIRRKRFATTAELLSMTRFNRTARTTQGDRARKALVRVKTNKMN